MKNKKSKLLASFLLPACTSVSVMSGSTAFARKATKISKAQNIVVSQKNVGTGAAERRSTKIKDMSAKSSSKKVEKNQAAVPVAKVTKKITDKKNTSNKPRSDGAESMSESGSFIENLTEGDISGLQNVVNEFSSLVEKNDVFSELKSLHAQDGNVELVPGKNSKISSSSLAKLYLAARKAGFYDVDIVKSLLGAVPGISEEMAVSGYFDSQETSGSMGMGVFVTALNPNNGEAVGQVTLLPDPRGDGYVKVQSWATNKGNFESTLRAVLKNLGANSKVKGVSVTVLANSGDGYKQGVKSVFDSKPDGFKKYDEIKRSDYMEIVEGKQGFTLRTGSTKSVNGAKPITEASHEVALKDEEVSMYKQMISAGKLSVGSDTAKGNSNALSVDSIDYDFLK